MSTEPAASMTGRPAAEQYLARVLPLIPARLHHKPGSREFRQALYTIAEQTGIMPTRTETARALRALSNRASTPIDQSANGGGLR